MDNYRSHAGLGRLFLRLGHFLRWTHGRIRFGVIFPNDELIVERQCLEHEIPAFAILVRKRHSDVEPVRLVLFTRTKRINTVERFLFLGHGICLLSSNEDEIPPK